MKFENYSLVIQCDETKVHRCHFSWSRPYELRANFQGKTAGECRRKARKVGWRVAKAGKKDLCPGCHEQWKKAREESRRKKANAS